MNCLTESAWQRITAIVATPIAVVCIELRHSLCLFILLDLLIDFVQMRTHVSPRICQIFRA